LTERRTFSNADLYISFRNDVGEWDEPAAMEALKMGQIDAVMEIAAIPTSSITELSLTNDIQIIQFTPGYREKLIEASPEYLPMTIPAGTYKK